MTQKWIKAIRDSGLTYIRKHAFRETISVYESLHKWQGMVMGKYLIIPVSFDTFADISENSDHFKRFEDEVVSPFYFSLKGDWIWNLYVVFVLEEPDLLRITADRLSLVQRGKRFGKKIIVSAEQLSDRLPLARIPHRLDGAAAADPLREWQEHLALEGLLFCLDNFRQQPLKEYLESDVRYYGPLPETPVHEVFERRPAGRIHSLHVGEQFRPHCLAHTPALQFSQINLLEGPNGMGKTSILECIELAYTGSVQRNLLVDRTATEDWDGRLIIGDNEGEFTGIPAEAEKKIREAVYYKHKVAPRGSSQLNRAFHQYNYFSSESVHQFCFNPGYQVDYRSAFARVIFGEQLERYEQCWTQHLDEFRKMARHLKGEERKLQAELDVLMETGIGDSQALKERVLAVRKSVAAWMKRAMLNYPVPDESSTLLEVEQWLQHLKIWLHELDVISAPFASLEQADVHSGEQLVSEENTVNAAHDELLKQATAVREQLEQLPPVEEMEQNTQQLWDNFETRRKRQDALQHLLQKINQLAHLIDQRGSRKRREQIEAEMLTQEKSFRQLLDVWNLYGHLADVELPSLDVTELQKQISQWEERHDQAQAKQREIKERISEHKVRTNKLQALLSELKATARQYVHEHPDQSDCPLCGHDHGTAALLSEAIEASVRADDDILTAWLAEEDRSASEQEASAMELARLKQAVSILEQMGEARIDLLGREEVEETAALSDHSGLREVQDVLKRIRARMTAQKNRLAELRQQAHELDQRGITIQAIQEWNELLDGELLAGYRHRMQSGETSSELVAFITNELTSTAESVEAARAVYIAGRDRKNQVNQSRDNLILQLDELHQRENQLVRRKNDLQALRQAWVRLQEKNAHIPERYSWLEWRQIFQKLLLASEELAQAMEPRILLEEKAREAADLNNRLGEITAKLARCNHAVHVLSGLRSLAQYGDDFVRSNFAAISQLFVALHSPNEFERLEWTADDKIVARRKGSDRTCSLHQMSTGQRTSVILAVFFIMHLVMESAPQFLLLDEPVANMDELNVVGLLDFLRQLAITRGTQIFFTTANPQIATLFRRKFSLLEDRFRTFHLRRDIEGPVRIHVQQYVPYQERPISLSSVQ